MSPSLAARPIVAGASDYMKAIDLLLWRRSSLSVSFHSIVRGQFGLVAAMVVTIWGASRVFGVF